MADSARGTPETPAGACTPPPLAIDPLLDVRTASANRLITEVIHVEDLLGVVDVDDVTIVDLIRHEQSIREELGRRETLLTNSLRWATESSTPVSRPAGRAWPRAARAGNRSGRSGPGRWDD